MMMTIENKREQKTKEIETRNSGLAVELQESTNQRTELTQSLVWDCKSLSAEWRSLIALIGDCDDIDYRSMGTTLRVQAKQSQSLFEAVLGLAKSMQAEGLEDLRIAIHEMENIQTWLDCWPKSDPDHRERVRVDVEHNGYCTDDELLELMK